MRRRVPKLLAGAHRRPPLLPLRSGGITVGLAGQTPATWSVRKSTLRRGLAGSEDLAVATPMTKPSENQTVTQSRVTGAGDSRRCESPRIPSPSERGSRRLWIRAEDSSAFVATQPLRLTGGSRGGTNFALRRSKGKARHSAPAPAVARNAAGPGFPSAMPNGTGRTDED